MSWKGEACRIYEERVVADALVYKAHVARTYDADLVARVATALEDINNQIGYEEK